LKTISKKIGLCLAGLHLIGFFVVVFCINRSADPQAPLLWFIFKDIDFPISLLYRVAHILYVKVVSAIGETFIAYIVYPPHLLHGLVATIWWFFLPRLFMPRRFGGIWGKKRIESNVE
jgi:hypothetical protein